MAAPITESDLDRLVQLAQRSTAKAMNANACQTSYDHRKANEAEDAFEAFRAELNERAKACADELEALRLQYLQSIQVRT